MPVHLTGNKGMSLTGGLIDTEKCRLGSYMRLIYFIVNHSVDHFDLDRRPPPPARLWSSPVARTGTIQLYGSLNNSSQQPLGQTDLGLGLRLVLGL